MQSRLSTLSRVANSWVLARADRPRSWDIFMEALISDVADIQGGTTPEGIHLGAMAGTVDVLQRCYTGLELRGDVLCDDQAERWTATGTRFSREEAKPRRAVGSSTGSV